MNYLLEVLEFNNWYETHPLSKGSISLWYALMHTNNKCHWLKKFSVPMSVLQSKSGLSKKELILARKALVSSGRITLFEHSSREAAIYTINPFFDVNGNQIFDADKTNEYDQLNDEKLPIVSEIEKTNFSAKKAKNDQNTETISFNEINNESENISENSDKDRPENFEKKCHSNISATEDKKQKNENILPNEVLNESNNESIIAPQKGHIKLNKTKQNKTKLNNLEEDKSSSSAGDVQKFNLISFFDEYNELCTRLPKAKIFSKRRAQEVGARYHEHGEAAVHEVIRLAAESDFLSGNSKSGWRANFDWIFLPTNFIKILEGYYGNKLPNSNFADSQGSNSNRNRYADEYIGKPSPFEILEQSFKDIYGDDEFAN
ncbi:MAG: hypothetical protein ACM3MI_00645 [Clostridiales bacterium]